MKIHTPKANISVYSSYILLVLFFVVVLARFFRIIDLTVGNMAIVIIGGLSFVQGFIRKGINYNSPLLIFFIGYILLGLISFFYNSNMDIQETVWPMGFMGISILLLNNDYSEKIFKYVYYLYCFISLYIIIVSGGVDFVETQGSRNAFSVYISLFYSLYLFEAYKNKSSISIFDSFIGALVCFIAVGRSGVLLGTIMLSIALVFNLKNGTACIRKLYILPIVLIVILILSCISFSLFPSYVEKMIWNLQDRGMASVRTEIWSDYINKCLQSFVNVILGAEISGSVLLDDYSENLHNSLLMLHAKYGLVALIIVLVIIIKRILQYVREKNMYLVVALVILIFRMNFDYTNFNGFLDIALFCLLFYREPIEKNDE